MRQRPSDQGGARDYESFCAALGSSARGRAFLAEYAKRNRNADTELLLAALGRLEVAMHGHADASDSGQMRRELMALHDAISSARARIDDSSAATRAARLATLIEQTERHIAAMLAPPQTEASDADRYHLAVVPALAEPELPIPSPANDQPRSISLVLDPIIPRSLQKSAEAQIDAPAIQSRPPLGLPEIDFFDDTSPPPITPRAQAAADASSAPAETLTETAISVYAASIEFPAPGAPEDQTHETRTEKPAHNALAAIMALSEAERLALFT